MPKSTPVQMAEIKKDTEYLLEKVDKLNENLDKNFITKNSHKLELTEAIDEHNENKHKSILTNNKIILAAVVLLGGSSAGAGGDWVRETLTKIFGG